MWWPFGRSKKEEPPLVPAETKARLQRKCVATRRAWQSCVQANKEDPHPPCERLAIRHMECLAEVVAPAEATLFQQCTSRTGNRTLMDGRECSQEAADMASSLQKIGLYPFIIQPKKKAGKRRRKREASPMDSAE
ncbi:hypothetical protein WJX84_005851 [Apatococcus fuscideae]|uniref:COX assembly mitochondrial protein n=1 Tax=Apatococcus fuscideae TaxID=2026836 RepID=A0AAW1T0F6_9CHLO